jgi:hypothetical protein
MWATCRPQTSQARDAQRSASEPRAGSGPRSTPIHTRPWRKKFNAGKDARAHTLYDEIMRICEQTANPREAVINLLKKTIWRGH